MSELNTHLHITISQALKSSSPAIDFECDLRGSNIIALSGHSGVGKTTVLRMIAGLQNCDDANINVNGITWQNAKQSLPTHLRSVAMVFQHPSKESKNTSR